MVKVSKLRQSMIWNNEMWILWSREDNNDNDMNEVQGFLHLDFGKEGLFVSFEWL